MFCDGCGTVVQPGQAFCSKCGKQIVGPISFMQPRPGRVQEHVRFIGLLWLAFSAFNTIGGVALYVVANTILVHRYTPGTRKRPSGVSYPAVEHDCDLIAGQSGSRIPGRLGLVAARAMGARARSRAGICFSVHQHPIRDRARHLHDVGTAARGFGAGVRSSSGSASCVATRTASQLYAFRPPI